MHSKYVEGEDIKTKVRYNHLKVKLKNAIMQTWSEVKKKYETPSINDTVNELLKNKKAGQVDHAQLMRDKQK